MKEPSIIDYSQLIKYMKLLYSRSKIRVICTLFAVACGTAKAGDFQLKDGDRIIIAGDSIPNQKMWPHYMASYLLLMNPQLTLHVQVCARGGTSIESYIDNGNPNYEQYSKLVYAYEPNFVFFSSSINGGYDKAKHKAMMLELVNSYIIGRSHAAPILLGMAPLSNSTGSAIAGEYDLANEEIALSAPEPLFYHKTWTALKDRFTANRVFTADAVTDTCASVGHGFSNRRAVTLSVAGNPSGPGGLANYVVYYVRDATANTFKLSTAPDGPVIDITTNGSGEQRISETWPVIRNVITDSDHPGRAAQIAYAWKVIAGLGFSSIVSTATIASDTKTLTDSQFCSVSSIVGNSFRGVDFKRLDARLPWGIDESGRAGAEFLYPDIKGWQKYMLTVTGLASGRYDVYINDVNVADVSAAELAAGWNMADLTTGPVHDQVQEVLGRIRDMHWVDRKTLASKGAPWQGVALYESNASAYYNPPYNKRGVDLIASLSNALASVAGFDGLVHTAAQPTTLSFSIRRKNSIPWPDTKYKGPP